MKRILVGLVAALSIILTGCSSYDVEQDQTGIEIDGYLVNKTDKKLVTCHGAGKSGWGGSGNDTILLPAGQRTFSFTGNAGSELPPMPVTTHDLQTQDQPGFIKFTLTTDCDALYDFWTKVGIKNDVDTDGGWSRFLSDYFGVPVSTALNDITSNVPKWTNWYNDSARRTTAQADLVPVLQKALDESLGSPDWIKVNSVSLARPVPSDELKRGIEQSAVVEQENKAIEQKNAGLLSKYDSMDACINDKNLPKTTCELMYLSESGGVTFYPFGSNLNVAPSSN